MSANQTVEDHPGSEEARPERRVAGMPVRLLVTGTLVALILAGAAGAIVALSVDDESDDDGIVDLAEVDGMDPIQPDEIVGRPVAADYTTFDGRATNTASYLGRPLVLNFFAEWCPPCVAEMPAFEAVYQEQAGEVAFLGISTEEEAEDGQALIASTGITYDVGRDEDGSMFAEFEGTGMPTTVFIDRAGTVLEVHSGALTSDELRDRIAEHFG